MRGLICTFLTASLASPPASMRAIDEVDAKDTRSGAQQGTDLAASTEREGVREGEGEGEGVREGVREGEDATGNAQHDLSGLDRHDAATSHATSAEAEAQRSSNEDSAAPSEQESRPSRSAALRAVVGYEGQTFSPKYQVPWQSALALDVGVLIRDHHYLSMGYRALPSIQAALRDNAGGQAASVSITRLPFSFAYGYSMARKRLRLDIELRGTVDVARTSTTLIALGDSEGSGISRTKETAALFALGPALLGHVQLARSLSLVLGVGVHGQIANRRWSFAPDSNAPDSERVTFLLPAPLRVSATLGLCILLP